MKSITGSTVGALILCLGMVTSASAGSVSGAYSYALVNETSVPACQTTYGGNPWTDNFTSTSGGNSVDPSDPVSFSICDGITGFLDGGTFTLGGGANVASGIFSGVLTGISGGGGDIFDGTFTINSETGNYAGLGNPSGSFEVVTGQVNTPDFVNGTFVFQAAPEPVTTALTGSGLLLVGLFRRSLKRRAIVRE